MGDANLMQGVRQVGQFQTRLICYERAHAHLPHQVVLEQPKSARNAVRGVQSDPTAFASVVLSSDDPAVIDPLVGTKLRIRVTFEVLED